MENNSKEMAKVVAEGLVGFLSGTLILFIMARIASPGPSVFLGIATNLLFFMGRINWIGGWEKKILFIFTPIILWMALIGAWGLGLFQMPDPIRPPVIEEGPEVEAVELDAETFIPRVEREEGKLRVSLHRLRPSTEKLFFAVQENGYFFLEFNFGGGRLAKIERRAFASSENPRERWDYRLEGGASSLLEWLQEERVALGDRDMEDFEKFMECFGFQGEIARAFFLACQFGMDWPEKYSLETQLARELFRELISGEL